MSFHSPLSCSVLFAAALALTIISCGLFTIRTATDNSQQDLFVSFQGNAVIFGSFQSALPGQGSNPYTYFCGVGLKKIPR